MIQQSFKTFLIERYVNALKSDDKKKYMQEVWDILQSSYAYIGGIKGEEFKTPESMLKVPFWKLVVKDGKVVACHLYKDLNGRKSIAGGTDGSRTGKIEFAKMAKDDFKRSYSEVSGASEKFINRNFPELFKDFSIPSSDVEAIIGKKITPLPDGYHYKRIIGGEEVTKIMIGTSGKKIY